VIYRAYRKDLLSATRLDQTLAQAFTPQLCIRCAQAGKKYTDIPSDEPRRVGGASKMRVIECGLLAVKVILSEYFFRYDRN